MQKFRSILFLSKKQKHISHFESFSNGLNNFDFQSELLFQALHGVDNKKN